MKDDLIWFDNTPLDSQGREWCGCAKIVNKNNDQIDVIAKEMFSEHAETITFKHGKLISECGRFTRCAECESC